MTTQDRQQFAVRIEKVLLFVWGITLLLFPLAFSFATTDAFILPKALLVGAVAIVSCVLWGVLMVLKEQVRIRRTPFDVPVLLFVAAVLLSSIFSTDRFDSLAAMVTVVFGALSYFMLVNVFSTRKVAFFLLSSLVTGSALAGLISVLSYLKIYVLPFAQTKTPTFTTFGSYLETAVVLAVILPLVVKFVMPALKQQFTSRVGIFALAGVALVAGLVVSVMALFSVQKPTLLPFDTGFQTAFAAISQDSGRVLQTFLFGEGYGTFGAVFTRFHNASLNANQQLWFLSFNQSSSYLLELLATTGLVGTLSFPFLAFRALTPVDKKKSNPFYVSLVILFVLSALLPFSFIEISLLFFLLAGFTLAQRETKPEDYFDIELKFVALKKGVFSFTTLGEHTPGKPDANPTPIAALVVLVALALLLGFYTTTYALSDITFQQSLVAANSNNGTATYRLQAQAISEFPYRSAYFRIFSQTNIALANSLLALQQSNHSSPSATTQQTAYTLIQQAITTGRQATTLAPESAVEWQNLSSVYRALIGVGQNADQFAIAAAQQAVTLDSVNPQEYVTLGGLYYQLGQYDNAIRMFQQAVTLKSDYANAYYNLGHAYEQKQDYQNALAQYNVVKQLVANNQSSEDQINKEIQALQAKAGNGSAPTPAQQQPAASSQEPLALPSQSQLPAQPTQVPLVSPTKTP